MVKVRAHKRSTQHNVATMRGIAEYWAKQHDMFESNPKVDTEDYEDDIQEIMMEMDNAGDEAARRLAWKYKH